MHSTFCPSPKVFLGVMVSVWVLRSTFVSPFLSTRDGQDRPRRSTPRGFRQTLPQSVDPRSTHDPNRTKTQDPTTRVVGSGDLPLPIRD